MSNALDKLIERLPRHFAVEEHSNNYKLLSIIAEQSNQNQAIMDTILRFWDVDQAEGVGLDRLGKDEGVLRGGMSDDEYRKMIKIQCILNMSDGDIPTMNDILDVYMGEYFVGLQDALSAGFTSPATLIMWLQKSASTLNHDLIKKVKPAGVAIIIATKTNDTFVWIVDKSYHYPIHFKFTGEMVFEILETHQSNAHINLQDVTYSYNVDFDVYEVETTNIQGALPVQDATYDYNVTLQRTGEMEPISAQTTVFAVHQATYKNAYSYQVIYPITGEAITGEGWFE